MLMELALLQVGFFAIYGHCYLKHDLDVEASSQLMSYLKDLINLYSSYDIHFHFDSNNRYLVNQLIRALDLEIVATMVLSNYDQQPRRLRRIFSQQVLHVVVLDAPSDFGSYSKREENTRRTDVVLFVSLSRLAQGLLELTGLKLFGNVVIVASNHNMLQTYTANVTAGRFTDFHGQTFKISFIDYFPLVWCAKQGQPISIGNDQYRICENVKGTEYELISTLAQRLNFKIVPVYHDDDYLMLINQTGLGLFDVAMGGITVTAPRSKLATFTTIYWYEGYNCLFFFGNRGSWSGAVSFLQPLQGVLWISFIAACVIVVVIFYLIGKCQGYQESNISVLNILWACMYFLVDQQVPVKSISKLQKRSIFVLCAWCLVCLNMSTAYKSKLLSTLLNPLHREPQNLEELAEKGYKFVVNSNYGDVVKAFLSNTRNTGQRYLDVLRHPIFIDTVCDEFDYAATHRAAVIDEYTSLQFEVRNTCHEKLKKYKNKIEDVRITKPLKMFGHGWALQKRAPFEDVFNRLIHRVVRAGLILKWRQDLTRGMDNNKTFFRPSLPHAKENKGNGRVSLQTLMSPFFVYIMGNTLGLVAFLGEIIFYRRNAISGCI